MRFSTLPVLAAAAMSAVGVAAEKGAEQANSAEEAAALLNQTEAINGTAGLEQGRGNLQIDPNNIEGSVSNNINDLLLGVGICNFNVDILNQLNLAQEIQMLAQLQQLIQLEQLGLVSVNAIDALIQQELFGVGVGGNAFVNGFGNVNLGVFGKKMRRTIETIVQRESKKRRSYYRKRTQACAAVNTATAEDARQTEAPQANETANENLATATATEAAAVETGAAVEEAAKAGEQAQQGEVVNPAEQAAQEGVVQNEGKSSEEVVSQAATSGGQAVNVATGGRRARKLKLRI